MEIIIGSDHAGFEMKEAIRREFGGQGLNIFDAGTHDSSPVDYPDIGRVVAEAVASGRYPRGILICGGGSGMSITANRFPGIRAALCFNLETAELSRRHNDANILVLPGRFLAVPVALAMVHRWLDTPFEGGRHQKRLDKIAQIDKELHHGE